MVGKPFYEVDFTHILELIYILHSNCEVCRADVILPFQVKKK